MSHQHSFKWRHFQPDMILLCVRWYLRYALSYRDLEELMLERGLHIDHTTIYRWCSGMRRDWKNVADRLAKHATTPGALLRPILRSKTPGSISTEPSIPKGTPRSFS
jgi:transposase-like protein